VSLVDWGLAAAFVAWSKAGPGAQHMLAHHGMCCHLVGVLQGVRHCLLSDPCSDVTEIPHNSLHTPCRCCMADVAHYCTTCIHDDCRIRDVRCNPKGSGFGPSVPVGPVTDCGRAGAVHFG
jgi:hypothetical protein